MDENDLVRRLGLLTDDSVDPPDNLRRDLWLELENQLSNTSVTETQHRHSPDADDEAEAVVPHSTGRRRHFALPIAAAVAFIAVVAVAALILLLRPQERPDPAAGTTTSSPTIAEDGSADPQQIVIASDGTILLPEGLFPQAITDRGDSLVVVVAEHSLPQYGAPPQQEGTVLAVDRGSGEVRWQRGLDGGPSLVETSEDAVWVAHFLTGAVTKLDLETGEVLGTSAIELPFDVGRGPDRRHFIPNDLEVAFGSLWISSARGAVAEVDLESGALIQVTGMYSDDIPASVGGLASSDTHLWVAAEAAGVFLLNPDDHSTELIGLTTLDHTGSSLVFHNGTMFVGGNRLVRNADGEFAVSQGNFTLSADDSHVTGLDPETLDSLGSAPIPSSAAVMMVVGDQLIAWDGHESVWPINDEDVIAGPPVRLDALDTMPIGDTGSFLWLIDWTARALHPLTISSLLSSTTTTTTTGAEVESDAITTFHPEIMARNGRAYLEVTFPDRTMATLSWPEELDLAVDGVFLDAAAYIPTPEGDDGRTLSIRRGSLQRIAHVFGEGFLLDEYPGADGTIVQFWSFPSAWEWDYLVYEFNNWVVMVYDYRVLADERMTEDERSMWARSLNGSETESGFLILDATEPLRIYGRDSTWPTQIFLSSPDGDVRLEATRCEISDPEDGHWCDATMQIKVSTPLATGSFESAVRDNLQITDVRTLP